MAKGRIPTPTNVKQIQGTIRKDRQIDHITSEALTEIPDPPEKFNELEVRLWDALTGYLHPWGLLDNVGLPNLISWCRFMGRHIEAEDWLAENGKLYHTTDKNGDRIPHTHPYHRMSVETNQQAQRIGAEYGITPAMRTKILNTVRKIKKDEDFS